ncbi:type II toxin-antitoxin system RelE/ParE family toxin [Testudinibacter sp. TR-2022]|nr:type II toxin-antitoxin system RelE/ParE family toxin [Testudinibacter sp. TR-2022]TNH04381.1 type II toxin-antitoxin system RelE/ParE family toxin [Pasteurellaceae bacterium Phil11]TNH22531.1 type II toxin-antitoxin system RelE/ParE family toxin [Testudinibacter sp. TR-2022]TNH23663.1 type II toxin-antitoxin system RelE/ParE family toxin [Testudinibacter sp. TR-2022]
MRIFKTKIFAKFAEKHAISDSCLIDAVKRAEKGLIDADLGGNVIKQRVARQGQGKSSGYRVLILYRINGAHYFISGFSKSRYANISKSDEYALKLLAEQYAM